MGFLTILFGKASTDKNLAILVKEGAFLVDVRTPSEFSGGHVEGSTNIPLFQVENQISKFKGKKHIVVFCRSGNRSSQAIAILEKKGFKNVTNGGTWKNINSIMAI